MRSRRWPLRVAVSSAAVLALVAATGPTGSAAPPSAPDASTTKAANPATPTDPGATTLASETPLPLTNDDSMAGATKITLITGDVVSYLPGQNGGEPQVQVTGGHSASFSQLHEGDSYYVFPSEARALIAAGKLDKALFDVAYLAKNGYADDASNTLPVIVQYPTTIAKTGATALSTKADALPATTAAKALPVVSATAVKVAKKDAATFWSSVDAPSPTATTLDAGVSKIWLDRKVKANLDVSVPQIGAPEAWAAGYDGKSVKVAVLDTGIDATHPDLADRVLDSRSFVDGETVQDGFGHGTHVASTIVGSGAASDGKYKGVAPGARLMVGKVLSNDGVGTQSQVIAGMQWAAESGAKVVSMSLSACCTDGSDLQSQTLNDLSARYGTLFVVAAGNEGPGNQKIGSPGTADAALTVAAVDKQDQMAAFSSRGPRFSDYGLKPDIAGPGVNIVAARAAGTSMPGAVHVGDKYTTVSGTSMATPHVAGAAAILAQEHPDWTGQKIKAVLTSTTKDVGADPYEQGAGRVDVARAYSQNVYSSGPLSFGWVNVGKGSANRTLTYTNDGDTAVTLNLTANMKATTLPSANVLSVSPTTLTVPAHGTADATVTFDVSDGPNTYYGGAIHATTTDGGITVNTMVGGVKQARQVKVNLSIINPSNASAIYYGGFSILRLDDKPGEGFNRLSAPAQSVSGTVDAGIYAIFSNVTWRDATGEQNHAVVANSNVDATGAEVTVTFDLRKAQPVAARTPKSSVPYSQEYARKYYSEGGATWGESYELLYGVTRMWALDSGPIKHGKLNGFSSIYLGADPVTMSIGGPRGIRTTLHPLYQNVLTQRPFLQAPVTMLDGRSTTSVVTAGHGLPADFDGLDARGRIVLLDLSDLCPAEPVTDWGQQCSTNAEDRVQNAKDAGAIAVLGYGTVGRQFLLSMVGVETFVRYPTYVIPTMSLTAQEGRALAARIAKGPVSIDVNATKYSPYLYALGWSTQNRLPIGLKTVSDRDLYRSEQRLHADAPGPGRLRLSALPRESWPLRGYDSIRTAPFTVTTYTGPLSKDIAWATGATGVDFSEGREDPVTKTGSDVRDWGEQPRVPSAYRADPRTSPYYMQYCYACRVGDTFATVRTISADGTKHGYTTNGRLPSGENVTDLQLSTTDGTEIVGQEARHVRVGSVPYFTLPKEHTTYRLSETFHNPLPTQRYGLDVRSERTFTSERPTDGLQNPVLFSNNGVFCPQWHMNVTPAVTGACQPTDELFLGYDFGLDLDNTRPAGSPNKVTITGFHSPYLSKAPRLTSMKLWLSYDDGHTWTQIKTHAARDGSFTANYVHPALNRTTGAVTVRAEAVDSAGNTLQQTIDRAYGLSAPAHHTPGNATLMAI